VQKLIKKFPSVWEKISENRRGDFFDSHYRTDSKAELQMNG